MVRPIPRSGELCAIGTERFCRMRTVYMYVRCYNVYLCFFFVIYNRHTEGYSGSDLTALARDAALGPIRGRP